MVRLLQDDQANIRQIAAQNARRMHQESRELRAQCRSLNERLKRALNNQNQRGIFECYICQAKYNRKDRMVAHIRDIHIFGEKSLFCVLNVDDRSPFRVL